MNFNDISALVEETLNFDPSSFVNEKEKESLGFIKNLMIAPQKPGVIYKLEKKVSTYIIRIYSSENLNKSYKDVINNPSLYPSLRLDFDQNIEDQISFFETENFYITSLLQENFANKRFPLFEENIFNISDPSDHWWLQESEEGIRVFFKSTDGHSTKNLIKLGPLNGCGFKENLKDLYGYFKLLFELKEYNLTRDSFILKPVSKSNLLYKEIYNLFTQKHSSDKLWNELNKLECQSEGKSFYQDLVAANYIMIKLNTLRSFWKIIERNLALSQ